MRGDGNEKNEPTIPDNGAQHSDAGQEMNRRIQSATEQQQRYLQRMQRISQTLKESLSPPSGNKPTYLEYLEFSSAEEFRRFRNASRITRDDIASVNWEELTHDLVAS